MQTAFKIIVISIFIALVSYGVGLLLKSGNSSTVNKSGGTAVSGSGILYSQDRAETWEQKVDVTKGQNISKYNVTEIVIHPSDPNIIFAGTDGGGLYRSVDGANHWENLSDGLLPERVAIRAIDVDRVDTERLFVSIFKNTQGVVLRSEDRGNTFTEVYSTSREKIGVNDVIVSPINSNEIFIATDDGFILESSDNGESWRQIWPSDKPSSPSYNSPILKLAQNSAGVIYAVIQNKGLIRSTNMGETWLESQDTESGKRLQSFPGGNSIDYVIIDPQNPSNLYLGTSYGLLRSIDGGNSFTAPPLIVPPRTLPFMSIAIDPHNSNTIYVGVGETVYRSEDGGEHWSVHAVPTSKRLSVMVIFPNDSNKMLIGLGK